MIVACKCLNILLNSKSDKAIVMALAIKEGDSHLTTCPSNSDCLQFFQKALGPITDNSIEATTNVPVLMHAVAENDWILYQCLHCDCIPFAKSNIGQYLVNPDLITSDEEIKYSKTNANYSPVFGILFNKSSHDVDFTYSQTNAGSDTGKHNQLTQRFRDAVQREIEATDERILNYTNNEFAQLKSFRERAEMDYNLMLRLLRNIPAHHTTPLTTSVGAVFLNLKNPLDTPPATPDSTPMSIGNSPNFKPTGLLSLLKHQSTPNKNSAPTTPISPLVPVHQIEQRNQFNNNNRIEHAMDASAFFFDMDGVSASDIACPPMSDVEESDSENEAAGTTPPIIGGLSIPRLSGRPKSLSIAQSLPISIPIIQDQHSLDDEYDEYDDADDNVDIAASIKALAKSVHGEALFGDLPRPRFSTQI